MNESCRLHHVHRCINGYLSQQSTNQSTSKCNCLIDVQCVIVHLIQLDIAAIASIYSNPNLNAGILRIRTKLMLHMLMSVRFVSMQLR